MYGFLEKRLASYSLRSRKKRLYIMPTRVGFYFSAVVFILFLISFSYGHSLAYSSAFILISILVISLPFTNYIINGVDLRVSGGVCAFEGDAPELLLTLTNKSGRYRFDLELDLALLGGLKQHQFSSFAGTLAPGQSETKLIAIGDIPHGHYQQLNIRLKSSFPFGLFFSWCYYSEDIDAWIYPKKRESPTNIQTTFLPIEQLRREEESGTEREIEKKILGEHDDFSHHSLFLPGHSFGSVDWNLYARSGTLYVKEFEGDIPQYECIELVSREFWPGIWALCYEIGEVAKRNGPFKVLAPVLGINSAVGQGQTHAHRILKDLVTFLEREGK